MNLTLPFRSPRRAKARPVLKPLHLPPPQPRLPLPGDLRPRLLRLARRYRGVAVGEGLALLLEVTCILFTAQMAADWLFDLPWLARAGFLLCDMVVWGAIYRLFLRGPLRRKLNLSKAALLVEAKWPQVGNVLITAVELAEGKPYSTRGSDQLVDVVLQQARSRCLRLNFKEVVPAKRLGRRLLMAVLVLAVSLGVGYLNWPATTLPLVQRLLLLNVPLPTRTIVIPVTTDLVVQTGGTVQIVADAQGVIPAEGTVKVTYADGSAQELPVGPDRDKPERFSLSIPNLQQAFHYEFQLNDGHGPVFSVQVRVAPTVDTLTCEQTYPAYTGLPPEKRSSDDLNLLAGSKLKISAATTLPVQAASLILKGVGPDKTVAATLDSGGTHLEAEIDIPAKGLTGFSVHLTDSTGFAASDETVYPIEIVTDEPPTVKITQPEDERVSVTLRAKPTVEIDAADDYGLSDLALVYEVTAPAAPGQEIGAVSPPKRVPLKLNPGTRAQQVEYVFDLAAQSPPWQEGSTVNYWVEAKDNNTATGPGITRTDRKQMAIVSEEAKRAEVLEKIKQVAAKMDSLSDKQETMSTELGRIIPSGGIAPH